MARSQITNSSLVPLTLIWDVARLQSVDVNSKEFKELLVRLYQYINSVAIALNDKDAGFYMLSEFVTGKQFFPNPSYSSQQNRGAYRTVINFGALPNASTKSVPHYIPITSEVSTIEIYGSATDPSTSFIPLPYSSATNPVELYMDATNINIITVSDMTAYTTCYVVIEYLKQ